MKGTSIRPLIDALERIREWVKIGETQAGNTRERLSQGLNEFLEGKLSRSPPPHPIPLPNLVMAWSNLQQILLFLHLLKIVFYKKKTIPDFFFHREK